MKRRPEGYWHSLCIRAAIGAMAVLVVLAPAGDARHGSLTPAEVQVVKGIIGTFPHVARDRYEALNGAYTWQVPTLAPCRKHWGLPLSSLDPYAAVFLKTLYGVGSSVSQETLSLALAQAMNSGAPSDAGIELFCDPMTWEFWLDPFAHKLSPKDDVGPEAASVILRAEILSNRSNGYVSAALRGQLDVELAHLKSALLEDERDRVVTAKIRTDVYAPLAAAADRSTATITLSEGLIRYAFIRAVAAHESELKQIIRRLLVDEDQKGARTAMTDLSSRTHAAFREALSFTLGHELAHLWVPTVDERQADCYGLATVIAERGRAEIGVFAAVNDALASGRSALWNGLPAQLIEQRFKLITVWEEAAAKGANIHTVCLEAWKGLEER